MAKKYKFKKNATIGSLEAENDQLLIKGFVEKDDYPILSDITNPKCILLGRTGVGKTAMIKYLEANEHSVARINPEEMSLTFLSNSDILQYFRELNVNLELFYKVLWKHVFIVELLKLHFGENYQKTQNFFATLLDKIKDKKGYKKRKEALEYLQTFEKGFWEKTEYRVKEIERSLMNKLRTELGVNAPLIDTFFKTGILFEKTTNEQTKIEVVSKAKNVVIQATQIERIYQIEKILGTEIFKDHQKKHWIVIDDLDKNWVDKAIVYDLIRAMVVVISEMVSRYKGVKIIISIRTNILQKVFEESMARGTQTEKYESFILDICWTKNEIKELLNNRLKELMRDTYTKASPNVEDIMPSKSKKKIDGFSYMIDRSFMRPRDIIAFFNKCIEKATGNATITREALLDAEIAYSKGRLKALKEEWLENYGDLSPIFNLFIRKKDRFLVSELTEEEIVESDIFISSSINKYYGVVQDWVEEYKKTMATGLFRNRVIALLYNIGLLGIKISNDEKMKFAYQNEDNIMHPEDINDNTKIYIHPMYHTSLRISTHSA